MNAGNIGHKILIIAAGADDLKCPDGSVMIIRRQRREHRGRSVCGMDIGSGLYCLRSTVYEFTAPAAVKMDIDKSGSHIAAMRVYLTVKGKGIVCNGSDTAVPNIEVAFRNSVRQDKKTAAYLRRHAFSLRSPAPLSRSQYSAASGCRLMTVAGSSSPTASCTVL